MKKINLKNDQLQLYKRENSNFWQIKLKLPRKKSIRKSSGSKILNEAKKIAIQLYLEKENKNEKNNLLKNFDFKIKNLTESTNLTKKETNNIQVKML